MSASHVTQREFAKLAGCDEKQVRRAVASGKLKLDADGKLDPALASSGWRKPIRSSRAAVVRADISEVSAPNVRTPRAVVEEDDTPSEAAAKLVMAMGASNDLNEAIRIKENFNALLKQLEYEQKSGSLIELAAAEQAFFNAFRAQRDSWLNWPVKVGPILAADLGIDEADRVTELLTAHVHKQIEQLGEPESGVSSGETQ
ncbi:MAG: hypothetical protein KUL86_06655 [Castellaniella sp.]|nr:hypothetical protein [Castellaniella sp.]